MGYRLLGFVVWKGGIWFVRRRYARQARIAAAAVVVLAVAGIAVAQARSGE